ncbi:hypothetical protein PR048_027810 [Dryococelus australis]|uniref:Uncharacterized protein n=1 Tax=Dryococelus australis TaxID=614101 RepID=A0ABQ9GHK3_9NEOP|nr:hypothetical protein PR048_027810 [Dryococelus australis]
MPLLRLQHEKRGRVKHEFGQRMLLELCSQTMGTVTQRLEMKESAEVPRPWVRELLYPEPGHSGGGWIVTYTGAETLAENGVGKLLRRSPRGRFQSPSTSLVPKGPWAKSVCDDPETSQGQRSISSPSTSLVPKGPWAKSVCDDPETSQGQRSISSHSLAPEFSLARSGDGALDARGSVALIAPALICLKRENSSPGRQLLPNGEIQTLGSQDAYLLSRRAIRVQPPAGSLPGFRMWESCRAMPLAGGFLGVVPFPPALEFQRRAAPSQNFNSCHVRGSRAPTGPEDVSSPKKEVYAVHEIGGLTAYIANVWRTRLLFDSMVAGHQSPAGPHAAERTLKQTDPRGVEIRTLTYSVRVRRKSVRFQKPLLTARERPYARLLQSPLPSFSKFAPLIPDYILRGAPILAAKPLTSGKYRRSLLFLRAENIGASSTFLRDSRVNRGRLLIGCSSLQLCMFGVIGVHGMQNRLKKTPDQKLWGGRRAFGFPYRLFTSLRHDTWHRIQNLSDILVGVTARTAMFFGAVHHLGRRHSQGDHDGCSSLRHPKKLANLAAAEGNSYHCCYFVLKTEAELIVELLEWAVTRTLPECCHTTHLRRVGHSSVHHLGIPGVVPRGGAVCEVGVTQTSDLHLLSLLLNYWSGPTRKEKFIDIAFVGATMAERLACSPPTKAIRVQSPPGPLSSFRMWESCRTMPLVGGFSRGSPISPSLSFQRCWNEREAKR